jgi:hypothetical protein
MLSTLMMEVISSSDTSVLAGATRRNISEGGIHDIYHEKHESYITLTSWAL